MKKIAVGALVFAAIYAVPASAGEQESVSTDDILNILIQQGVIDEKNAKEIIKKAKSKTRDDYQAPVGVEPPESVDERPVHSEGVVRVPYVPKYIKDEIRDEVRMQLREEVVADVMKQAEQEAWGVPGTNPDWTRRISFYGDIRLRADLTRFADQNTERSYRDFNVINAERSTQSVESSMNTTEDRDRLRARFRFGLKAKVTPVISVGARLATGSDSDPVSTNETMGQFGQSYSANFDQAYIKYSSAPKDVQLVGGRFGNPFFATDLIWDADLQFDGVAGGYYFNRSSSWLDDEISFDPYVSLGVFPLQEVELSKRDKWLYGLQGGFVYQWFDQDKIQFAVSYYHYENMDGIRNGLNDGNLYDYTAPEFFQKGNTVFNISSDPVGDPFFALASRYELIDVLLQYDVADFAPHHVIVTAEYVSNVGWDLDDAVNKTSNTPEGDDIGEATDGWFFGVNFGWPMVAKPGDWNVAITYKYLESDAVFAGFSDSDFHLGGTDGKGVILEAQYGMYEETWIKFKWSSTEEIDGPPLGVDLFQFDVNARF